MRKGFAIVISIILLFSAAAAENVQKAPDFILEGYDGDLSGRNWDENLFFKRMQEKTGVSFQFNQYTDFDKWKERKTELLAHENLPDVLFKAELSASEVRELYQSDVIIDLTPYLQEYAPDLWKLLEEHPEWKAAITMEDGSIPALPEFNTLQNNDAMWINSSWLRKLKMDMPKTAEELTETLRAFRQQDGNGNLQMDEIPLTFIGMWELRFLGHAFGIVDNDYYVSVSDGKVVSSLKTQNNREFLSWLHELWEEKLIDHSGFTTVDSLRQITDDKKTIPYGLILSSSPLTVVPESALSQYTLLEPLAYEGKQIYRDLMGDVVRGTFAITSECKEPEKLVAWVNLLYTEDVNILAHYGVEGEDYFWNENGYWEWMADLETVANSVLPEHTISEGGAAPGLASVAFQEKYSDQRTRDTIEQQARLKTYSVIPYPPVTLSAEDAARVAEIQKDLSAYVEKTMACFVTGDIELTDANWEEFCRTVDEKGLQEMIGIWQKYIR